MRPDLRPGRRWPALLAVLLVSGCGGVQGPPAAPADPGPVRPAAGGEPLVVESLPLEAPMVLDPIPDGFHVRQLENVTADPGPQPYRSATLYGDPSLDDTLDGPVLLVGRSSGSASIGGPPCCEGRTVDLGDREGLLVHDGDRSWVNIDPGRSDYVEFVVGRGIPDDALITAAAGAGFGTDMAPETATLAPEAVPPGLEPLVVGAPADGPFTAGAGEVIVLDGESTTIHISAVRADPRLSALWGFWTDDAAGTLVRGQPGSFGELHGSLVGNRGRAYVWAENGLVLSVISTGDGHDHLDDVVQNLRVGTVAEFEGMRRAAIDRVPTAAEVGCTDGTVVTAVDGDLRWGFGLQPDTYGPGTWSSCTRWSHPDFRLPRHQWQLHPPAAGPDRRFGRRWEPEQRAVRQRRRRGGSTGNGAGHRARSRRADAGGAARRSGTTTRRADLRDVRARRGVGTGQPALRRHRVRLRGRRPGHPTAVVTPAVVLAPISTTHGGPHLDARWGPPCSFPSSRGQPAAVSAEVSTRPKASTTTSATSVEWTD